MCSQNRTYRSWRSSSGTWSRYGRQPSSMQRSTSTSGGRPLPGTLLSWTSTAVVLAGGLGSRIGGDKALVQLGGRPLITYPLAAAEAAGLDAVVVAKRTTKLPALDVPRPARTRRADPSPPRRHHRARRAPGRDRAPLRHAVRRRRRSWPLWRRCRTTWRRCGRTSRSRPSIAARALPDCEEALEAGASVRSLQAQCFCAGSDHIDAPGNSG